MSKVLLIDDDPVVIDVYSAMFAAAGFEVRSACNGEAAREAVLRERPDAIVLDILMPKLGGWQWLAAIRGDRRFKGVPVMVLCAGEPMRTGDISQATMVVSTTKTHPQRVVEMVINALVSADWDMQLSLAAP